MFPPILFWMHAIGFHWLRCFPPISQLLQSRQPAGVPPESLRGTGPGGREHPQVCSLIIIAVLPEFGPRESPGFLAPMCVCAKISCLNVSMCVFLSRSICVVLC